MTRVVAPLLLLSACAGAPATPNRCGNFDWLIGTWTSTTSSSVETWTRPRSGTLEGVSKTVKNDEVVFSETLRIEHNAYHAAPEGQPAHTFPLRDCGETWATFSDPDHDWPKALTYRRNGDTLFTTVAGDDAASVRTETWTRTTQ